MAALSPGTHPTERISAHYIDRCLKPAAGLAALPAFVDRRAGV